MFWLILLAVALVVGLVLYVITDGPWEMILGIPILCLCIGFFLSCNHYDNPNGEGYRNCETVVVETQSLVSLNDGKEMSGSFFLGSGRVSTDMKFYAYVQGDDGFITLFEFPKDTKFKTTEGSAYYEKLNTKGIDNFWFINPVDKTEYVVYIPEGAFLNEYVLDLQ